MAEKKVQLNVLLPEKVAHQIRVVAEVDDERMSHAAERAITQYVAARKADPDWKEAHSEWAKKQRSMLRAL